MKLAILNTAIMTTDGTYALRTITLEEAKDLIAEAMAGDGLDSAVGHPATATLLTDLLGAEVPLNRQLFAHEIGQKALVFKLSGRPKEGTELDLAQLQEVGYTLKVMERLA